jgi:3-isopropylmalate dehydrogenase
MSPITLAVLPGDGIGPEVIAQALKLLKAIETKTDFSFEYHTADIGGAALEKYGTPLPDDTLALAMKADAVLLGAVGDPKWDAIDPAKRPEKGLLKIRKEMGLYANIRPTKLFHSLLFASTLKPEILEGVDILTVRELTGGIYFGEPREKTKDYALDTLVYHRHEIERIAIVAFEQARLRKKRVCSVDKANVLASSQLWREVVEEVAQDYPDISLSHLYVDNAAMQLLLNPRQFDVILTENMFGDILSDEASMLIGSLGMLPSASLGDNKRSLFEPSHGSAPQFKGQNKVNPIATLLSVAMMFSCRLAAPEVAQDIEQAIDQVLTHNIRTFDIAQAHSTVVGTSEMTDAIIAAYKKI